MLEHGGRLRAASQRYDIPLDEWVDLSTGVNPCGWPVPSLPADVWRRLPEDDDGLEEAARIYYGTPHVLAIAGTQAAIQTLPSLRQPCRVGVLHPMYAEHAHGWRQNGHSVEAIAGVDIDARCNDFDVVVLANPNNPTGERFKSETLRRWRERLHARDGWLVVDEAFADCDSSNSIAHETGSPGLIVLRSIGKFFGLAGIRAGFVLAEPALLARLRTSLGPWSVSGPARWVTQRALADVAWQLETRAQLTHAAQRLRELLITNGLSPIGGCALFQWLPHEQTAGLHDALARKGILVRLFSDPPGLRFGLPGEEAHWRRLAEALRNMRAPLP